jgi:hypothetical protein
VKSRDHPTITKELTNITREDGKLKVSVDKLLKYHTHANSISEQRKPQYTIKRFLGSIDGVGVCKIMSRIEHRLTCAFKRNSQYGY